MKINSIAAISAFLALALTPTVVKAAGNSGDFDGGVAIGSSYAGVDTAPTNGIIIQGNVGIGTSSPSYPFHATGANASGPIAYYDQTDNSNKVAIFHKSTSNNQGIIVGNSTDGATNGTGFHAGYYSNGGDFSYLDSYDWGAGVYKDLRFNAGHLSIIGSTGYVGIGTTSPSYQLTVNGTAYASGAAGALSDIRHKKNIEPLLAGLKEVEQLKPVTFEWKDPKDDGMQGQQIGLIAQDVEKVLPSVVLTENNAEKTKNMKYTEIIPVLVKAIQEQEDEIENQESEIDALKQTVEHLTQQKQPTP